MTSNNPQNIEPSLESEDLFLPTPQPWPDAVDGAIVLDELSEAIRRYVTLDREKADAIALWVFFAHAHDAFQISPRLNISSPVKGCGKTTLLSVLEPMLPRPLLASNASQASIFRLIDACSPTLMLDEADTFMHDQDGLRGVLNSGHTKIAARVVRIVGERNLKPKVFATWAPVVIAGIGKLPDTLLDRSLVVELQRKLETDNVDILRLSKRGDLQVLGQKAARWSLDRMTELMHADPAIPHGLANRQADNWYPLFAIADLVGKDWPNRSRMAAQLLSNALDRSSASLGIALLRDIKAVFDELDASQAFSEDLTRYLNQMEDSPWAHRGKSGLTTASLAEQLEPFRITPRQLRILSTQKRGYRRTDFMDAWGRYLPPDQAVTASQTAEMLESGQIEASHSPSQHEPNVSPGDDVNSAYRPRINWDDIIIRGDDI
jgi:hypothetical protein